MKITMGTCGYVVKITQEIDGEIFAAFLYQNTIYKTLKSAREGKRICEIDFWSKVTENGSRVEYKTSIERIWFDGEWIEGDSDND